MGRQCARARRMFTRNSHSELPARPPPSAQDARPDWDGAGERARTPRASTLTSTLSGRDSSHSGRGVFCCAASPPCSRPRSSSMPPLAPGRWPLTLAVTPPSPTKPPFSLEKLPRSRSRGGRHTNSAGRLLLPGACGVVTPRRRRGQAARTREDGGGRESGRGELWGSRDG